MAAFRKIKAGLVNSNIQDFVGEVGNMFFNIETGELRLSDGITPFGKPVVGGTGGGGFEGNVIYLDGGDAYSNYNGTAIIDGGGP